MQIESIIYDYYVTESEGETYKYIELGFKTERGTVTKIEEHRAAGEGDKWYYDIYCRDGNMESVERIFNIHSVAFCKYLK